MKKKTVFRFLSALLVLALAAGTVASCQHGEDYLKSTALSERYNMAREQFEQAFEPKDIRDGSGAIVDRDWPDIPQSEVDDYLAFRDKVVDEIRDELKRKGKIAIVTQPSWQVRGGMCDTPGPIVFLFN